MPIRCGTGVREECDTGAVATDDDDGLQSLSAPEREAVERFVRALVDHEVETLASTGALAGGSDPYLWTRNYGQWGDVDLIVPPGPSIRWGGSVIRAEARPGWAGVVVDMWTQQEGRSDLSLELDLATDEDATVTVQFIGLHVM